MALQQALQRAGEDLSLRTSILPTKGTSPCSVDVTDGSQRPAVRVSEQPLWQRGDEGIRRNRLRPGEGEGGIVVPLGCACSKTGEMKGDQTGHECAVADVVSGEIIVLGNHSGVPLGTWPVLANECAL